MCDKWLRIENYVCTRPSWRVFYWGNGLQSRKEYYRDHESRLYHAELVAEEGLRGYSDEAYRPPFAPNCPKAPMDLRDFTETATVKMKDGSYKQLIRQKAASPVRHIPVTPELNRYYCEKYPQ